MKKIFLSIILFSTISLAQGVFFSEYAEGSSNNKYIEIYNGTGSELDLSAYSLSSCTNGCDNEGEFDFPDNVTFTSGTNVAAGDVYVLCHADASDGIAAECDQTFIYLSNGDDFFALTQAGATSDTYVVFDKIGDFGEDPGSGWNVAGVDNATKNHTLIRKPNILNGNNGNWDTSAGIDSIDSEWIVLDIDDWSNIGFHNLEITSNKLVTFSVDAIDHNQSIINGGGTAEEVIYVIGNINNWSGYDIPLTDENGDGIYLGSANINQGTSLEYRYVGDVVESYPPIGSECDFNYPNDEFGNYGATIISDTLLPTYIFGGGCEISSALVENIAPIAYAGQNLNVYINSEVVLDGSSSIDPDGEIVAYYWYQTAGEMVFLSNENNVITTFIAPSNADSLSFSLVVTDDGGASDTSDISIIINMIHPENRLYVSNEGSDLNEGNVLNPFESIQQAINVSNDGDTIIVNPGLYQENLSIEDKSIMITSLEFINGDTSFITSTIITGNTNYQSAFNYRNSNGVNGVIDPVLNGFSILNSANIDTNNSSGTGGGISSYNSRLTMSNLIVSNNTAFSGGGVYANNSSITISNCKIISNNAIANPNDYALGGGGISGSGSIIIINSEILGNETDSYGGGIALTNPGNSIEISNTLIANNIAKKGGGIFLNHVRSDLNNVTIANNISRTIDNTDL